MNAQRLALTRMKHFGAVRWLVAFGTILFTIASCGDDGPSAQDVASEPTESLDCSADADIVSGSGEVELREIDVDGATRRYHLFVPTTYDPTQPAPVVLNFHALNASALEQIQTTNFHGLAEQEGVVVAYPQAVGRNWDLVEDSDVAFVDALIEEIAESACVDLDRVYAIGYSQGGVFSTFLACHTPDRIAAVASIAALNHHDPPFCQSATATPVFVAVGSADRTYSIEEGVTFAVDGDVPGPLADEVSAWLETNDCEPDPAITDVEGIEITEYACAEGNDVVVYIHDWGHIWPRETLHGFEVNEAIWEFLFSHSGD